MANLNITEFIYLGTDPGGNKLPAVQMPPIATQNVTIAGVSAATTNALNAKTGIIRLRTDTACAVLVGEGPPTALITSLQMDANTTEYFTVPLGPALKVAVIAI